MVNQDKNLKDILETVSFIKDNAATKEDLEKFATKDDLERFATKDDLDFLKEEMLNEFDNRLAETKDEIITKIDAFVVLNQKLDTELAALRSKYERLESTVQKMLAHFKLDL
ncbi:MAG: hypothetical protein NTX00_02615 [Candidatus Parcubacteria bacterium]|nr:hypothetical protein [Candidatus Parcubacteria bacterium]